MQVCGYDNSTRDVNLTLNSPETLANEESFSRDSNNTLYKSIDLNFGNGDPFAIPCEGPISYPQNFNDTGVSPLFQNELCDLATTFKINNSDKEIEENKEVISLLTDTLPMTTKRINRREKKQVHSRKGKFSEIDDRNLQKYVQRYGRDWKGISQQMP
jgi:hypothetical protein